MEEISGNFSLIAFLHSEFTFEFALGMTQCANKAFLQGELHLLAEDL